MTVGRLARIRVYPVKSLDPEDVHESQVRGRGGLEHDREYRMTGAGGTTLNTKKLGERISRIRSSFDFAFGEVRLWCGDGFLKVRLPQEQSRAEAWLSSAIGQPVLLERDERFGFPDDTKASGPTVVSTASLEQVAAWFDLPVEEVRRRFRANLEIEGVPPFWEDLLYGAAGGQRFFEIGETRFEAVNPSARCTVPSRDSLSGEIAEPAFAKKFARWREAALPEGAFRERFDHFYRFAVNTFVPESENGKFIAVGELVRPISRAAAVRPAKLS